jgi:hypothetical protein
MNLNYRETSVVCVMTSVWYMICHLLQLRCCNENIQVHMVGLCSMLMVSVLYQQFSCYKSSLCQHTELFLRSGLEGYCIAYCFNYAFRLLDRFLFETGKPEV